VDRQGARACSKIQAQRKSKISEHTKLHVSSHRRTGVHKFQRCLPLPRHRSAIGQMRKVQIDVGPAGIENRDLRKTADRREHAREKRTFRHDNSS